MPLPSCGVRTGSVSLAPELLRRYAGEYDFGAFTLDIKTTGTGLVIGNAAMGDFSLRAQSETDFIMEDLEAPLVFTLDESGNPLRVTAEFAPGTTSVGNPVQLRE